MQFHKVGLLAITMGLVCFFFAKKLLALKPVLRRLNRLIQEKVASAHKQLLQLQLNALNSPSSSSSDAVALQESLLSKLMAVEEAFLRQKSRIKWLNDGDQNTKYFRMVIKSRQSKMKILSIQNDERAVLSDERAVCSEFLKFYEGFLGTVNSDCNNGTDAFFQSLQLSTLTAEMNDSMVAEVTAEEVYATLKSMPCNKSPGPDGFTVEFFLSTWEIVGSLFVSAVQEFF